MTVLALPASIRLVEVGLRDGLQVVPTPVPVEDKLRLVDRLLDAGLRHLEVSSFGRPDVLPQLADAEEMMARVPRDRGAVYRGLVPNVRGAQRAASCGLDEMVALVCADEAVTQVNQRQSVEQVLAGLPRIAAIARDAGTRLIVGVAMAFFAPGRGEVSRANRMRCVDAAADAGADGIYLASSAGMDDPAQIAAGIADVRAQYPSIDVGVHLHSRNGMALANALAAMLAGASWLEAAFGGMGGDLWAPGDPAVLGNAPMEDLVHMTQCLGVHTGVDLNTYLDVVAEAMTVTGWTARSAVTAGGTRQQLATANWP